MLYALADGTPLEAASRPLRRCGRRCGGLQTRMPADSADGGAAPPPAGALETALVVGEVERLRELGNAAFKGRDFASAEALYSQALLAAAGGGGGASEHLLLGNRYGGGTKEGLCRAMFSGRGSGGRRFRVLALGSRGEQACRRWTCP